MPGLLPLKDTTAEVLHNGLLGDRKKGRCGEVAVMGMQGCKVTKFF